MPKPRKRYKVTVTQKGRVVYNRAPHEFTTTDLIRVFKRVIERDADETYVGWLVELLDQLIQIALETIIRIFAETWTQILPELIIKFLERVMRRLAALGVAAYQFLLAALSKAFGLQVIEKSQEVQDGGVERLGDQGSEGGSVSSGAAH